MRTLEQRLAIRRLRTMPADDELAVAQLHSFENDARVYVLAVRDGAA